MKAKFDIDELKKILSKVEHMAVSINTFPLLQCVKITTNLPDEVVFVATNSEIGIRVESKCIVEEEGEIFLNAKRLASLIRQLPGGEVKFHTTANDRVVIETGGSIFKFACENGEFFPELPVIEKGDLVISGQDLRRLFAETVWAVDVTNKRPYIGSVFFDLQKVRTVGTDRRIFVSHWIDMNGVKGEAILEKLLVTAVLTTFNNMDEVTIGVRESQIVFTAPGITLVGRLIESEFLDFGPPVFERVAKNAITMIVNRVDLIAILRRSLLFSTAANSIPRVTFILGDDLVVRSVGLIVGDSEERLDVDAQGAIELCFNGQLLLNALSSYNSENVIFKFDQPETPFSVEECDGVTGICVCMPLHLDGV